MVGLDRRRRLAAWRIVSVATILLFFDISTVWAHKGPPFALFLDKPAAEYRVSVWADPDIGQATFYVVVESPAGGPPAKSPKVAMWAEPISGRLQRTRYEVKRQAVRNQMQFEAKPYFDQRDMWTVGFEIEGSGGKAKVVTAEVESTPPGTGPWDLAIYLFPFLLIGGLWVMAVARRRRIAFERQKAAASRAEESQQERGLAETEATDRAPLPPG